ncbi:hypothetical protein [Candidatus Albibeggiatoa sp. nov. NOAA]|uniref:hypothetical protein n=1 Tax=Candidatus Albibeggiatoa sp. nov. NOAA TaxID=3162724 RepID=UPI0032F14838|nr:hypothetical protein [Thiotrichaceae bacterium]
MLKTTLFTVLLLISNLSIAGETLTFADTIGKWKLSEPYYDVRYKIASWIVGRNKNSEQMQLDIKSDSDIVFTRMLSKGRLQTIQASQVQIVDDVYIIWLPWEKGGKYKLVLAGWGSKYSDSKRLFGQIYLYNDEGLFNGWSVTFEPDTSEVKR